MEFRIAVLPGDGIGPEVIEEAVRVLEAVGRRFGHTFRWEYADVGGVAIDKYGTALPDATLDLARRSDAVLFGAVGGPKWDDPRARVRPEDGILGLRKHLDLFANLRPTQVYPELLDASTLKREVVEGVDLLVVREVTGGLYFARPKRRWETKRGRRRAVDTLLYTEEEILRVLRVGFELARARRRRLTSVDKANVLETGRLWRELANEVARDYPDVQVEHLLVDACAMQLVRQPTRFDVLVTENTFGDILTDETAVLAGSMGMLPSATLAGIPRPGERAFGLYEPIHGSAPDIAGQGIANPLAAILSAGMLLRYSLGLTREADAVERAVKGALAEGLRTPDLFTGAPGTRRVTTREMGEAVARRVEAGE